MSRSSLLFSAVVLCLSVPAWSQDKAPSLADQSVVAKYQAARHERDAYLAKSTIKNSDKTIQAAPARIKKEQKTVEQTKSAHEAAQKELAEKEAVAKAAMDGGNAEQLKIATQDLAQAKQKASRAKYAYDRAAAKLKSEQDRVEKAKVDRKAAEESIPKLEAAAKEASERHLALRKQARELELKRATTQKPTEISQVIDKVIDARLAKEKVPLSPQVEDGKFLRRVTLDIAGRIPTYAETVEFLASENPDKRQAAVDRLLASDDYGRTFGTIFADLTTHRPTTTATRTKDHFREWLIECLNVNRQWDDVVTDMLASEGNTGANPGSIFLVAYRLNNQPNPPDIIAATGEMFMGIQIACAQCHDHPFVDEWSMDDFWAMSALFSRTRMRGSSVYRALDYEVTDEDVPEKELFRMGGVKYPPPLPGGQIAVPDPTDETKTLKTIKAMYLDESVPELPEKGFYRAEFAEWLTSKQNPYFARATVNRLWAHFFARGLVQPVADMGPFNEATYPEILDALEKAFRESDYDPKFLARAITASAAYQRTSRPLDENVDDTELYSHMAVKTLEADALFDSLTVAIGRTPMSDNRRQQYKDLFDTRLPEVDPGKFTHSIPQVLRMMNGREYNDASSQIGTVTNGKEPAQAIEGLFLAALTRRPTKAELTRMQQYVEESENPRTGYADVYWVLINSAEFLVNH